jgi:putative molybdopterin biosynthesis protein
MFRKLLSFDEAKEAIEKTLRPKALGIEEVHLINAYNRILAEDAVSTLDIPPFNRSTVDGFAVKSTDTFGAAEDKPVKLNVCGMVNIGELSNLTVETGEAAEIVTGAPLPDGADAVVMVEDTDKSGTELSVFDNVTPDQNVQKRGSDIRNGETVLKLGQSLGSREIGVLAALGKEKIKAYRIPNVAILSTGDEVIEPGKFLKPGKIYDINAYSLSIAVQECGGKAIYTGVVLDEKAELRKALERALRLGDVVLTSGGVSVGPKDIIPNTVDSLGKPGVFISGIAVKPGKPATVALIGKKPVFSFPGHPTSALMIFQLLARPIIQIMAGKSAEEVPTIKAVVVKRMFSAKGRRTFVTVALKKNSQTKLITAEPVGTGASGAITTLAKADGFVAIPENTQFVDAGEEITVFLLK